MKQRLLKELKAVLAITAGTLIGVIVYILFLMGNIAIFGFNLGCIFAPIVAGLVEVLIAKKICDESTGAISAFALFIITVVYGFVINNPSFGFNLPTIGISIIIIQAAFPIAVNYVLIVSALGIVAHSAKAYTNINERFRFILEKIGLVKPKEEEYEEKEDITSQVHIDINNLNFLFSSTNNTENLDIEKYLGFYEGRILLKRKNKIVSEDNENEDKELLELFKGSQDKALAILANNIKNDNGNGVIDLSIEFDLVGLGGSSYQVIAKGTGVKLRENSQHL